MQKLKIVHLATSLSGGAGMAARRLNTSLNIAGHDSLLITIEKRGQSQTSSEKQWKNTKSRKFYSSAITAIQAQIVQSGEELITTFSTGNFDKELKILNGADIIHIHAFYNFLDIQLFEKILELEKPVFFTLHDQRLFTGGCHYSLECKAYENKCKGCPQVRAPFRSFVAKSQQEFRVLFEKHSNISIISPSDWLATLASQSAILNQKQITVIRNPIPKVYNSNLRAQARESYGFEPNNFVIAFSSYDLNNPYKGLSLLVAALNNIAMTSKGENLKVIFLGRGHVPNLDSRISFQKLTVIGDEGMAEALNATDLLIVPSTQDNSPSVVGEALMCGTKVYGSNIGGIPEILSKYELRVFDPRNESEIIDLIDHFETNYDHSSLSLRAREEFSETNVCNQITNAYRHAIEGTNKE
jgi:glycosyltransferase involved in cell wall biosynthesis